MLTAVKESLVENESSFDILREIPILHYPFHPAFQILDDVQVEPFDTAVAPLKEIESAFRNICKWNPQDLIFWRSLKDRKLNRYNQFLSDSDANFKVFKSRLLDARADWTNNEKDMIAKFTKHLALELTNEASASWRAFYYSEVERFSCDDYDSQLTELQKNGFAALALEREELAKLRSMLTEEESQIRKIDTWDPKKVAITTLNFDDQKYAEFKSYLLACFNRINLVQLASKYMRIPMQVVYVSLYVNREQDQWWQTGYQDAGLPLPETAEMHYDSYCGMMKCMVYLNEVTEENGPFCYIPGSTKAKISLMRRMAGKALPYAGVKLESPEERRFFLRLPSHLQNNSHFGFDLECGSHLERAYLRAERKFVSRDCNTILFDNYGLHRGGLVKSGERIALQINLMPLIYPFNASNSN